MNIEELFSRLRNDIIFPKKEYDIEGDIFDCSDGNGYLWGHIQYKTFKIRFYWQKPTLRKDDILKRHAIIKGKISIFNNEIQIMVISLNVDKISDSVKIYNDLKIKYQDYFKNRPQKLVTKYVPRKIALISVYNSDGYNDFRDTIQLFHKGKINYASIECFSADKVSSKIDEICDYNDVICLVRGGKDGFEYSLNNDLVLSSIVNAQKKGKYIVTGLGHSAVDNLLCDELADAVGNSPSDAAHIINNCLSYWYKVEKNTITDTNKNPSTSNIVFSLKKVIVIFVLLLIGYFVYRFLL